MSKKRFILASVAAFIFIFVFEWVLHGMLLMPTYEATADTWRMDHSGYFMSFMMGSQLLQALALAFFFTRHYEGKGLGEGVRFGLYAGIFLAAVELGAYCYLPVPLGLVLAWMGGALVKCIGVGAALALVYKN